MSLDKQKQPPYTSTHRKRYLIKQRQFHSQGYAKREVFDKVVIADLNLC
jgi:hypothetical protein